MPLNKHSGKERDDDPSEIRKLQIKHASNTSLSIEKINEAIKQFISSKLQEDANKNPESFKRAAWMKDIIVDRQEGILIGGTPSFAGMNLFSVTNDLHSSKYDSLV